MIEVQCHISSEANHKVCIRASLNYGEEVHQSRILGEWSNTIGYEMGSSLARVYTTVKTSLVENFDMDEKIAWLPS